MMHRTLRATHTHTNVHYSHGACFISLLLISPCKTTQVFMYEAANNNNNTRTRTHARTACSVMSLSAHKKTSLRGGYGRVFSSAACAVSAAADAKIT